MCVCACVLLATPSPSIYRMVLFDWWDHNIYIYTQYVCLCDPREGFVCASDRKTLWGSCAHTRRCDIYVFTCVCTYYFAACRYHVCTEWSRRWWRSRRHGDTVYDMWCRYDIVRRSCATENRDDRSPNKFRRAVAVALRRVVVSFPAPLYQTTEWKKINATTVTILLSYRNCHSR